MNEQNTSEVRINITNLHFAKVSEGKDAVLTFEKPERIIGAETATRKPKISSGELYGDGILRFKVSKKAGIELELEINSLPPKWRTYIEGSKISEQGVESATSKDVPNHFAVGWEVEKTGGKSEFIWFPYCIGEPIEQKTEQSEAGTKFSTDKISVLALEHPSIKRYYTFVDQQVTGNEKIDAETFFSQVQIADAITKKEA